MADLALATADLHAYESALRKAIDDRVASRLAEGDSLLWGGAAQSEASQRLGWTSLAVKSRPLVAEIAQLKAEMNVRGLDHVVLCGMGGSSLAPEVICQAAGVELTVLDSSQPDMVRGVLADRLERSIVVVSSKSGGTVETDSQRRAFENALTEAGLRPDEHLVIVTDPGSPLDQQATAAGYRVFHADPTVGGRYSALTAFGLVPSGLAGAPIGALLDAAEGVRDVLASDRGDNPALRLGVMLGVAHERGVDKLVLADQTRNGVSDWIEQLVAESTGKIGRGILPVVVPFENAINFNPSTADSVLVTLGAQDVPEAQSGYAAALTADLGALMQIWETAVAVAGRIIGINPFDQPDVESAKAAARELLDSSAAAPAPDATDGDIGLFGTSETSVSAAISAVLGHLDLQHGYVAVHAYLDRFDHADFADVRERLAQRTGRPVTFGWGPRFLHSTGQYHKGGTPNGVFIQITTTPLHDLEVPGRDFTFGGFIDSQAAGDASVLRANGRPVLRLHLNSPDALARVREALA